MDNQNNYNDFYGNAPQKPFNETPRQDPSQGFEPQHPFAPQPPQYAPQPPQYAPRPQQYTPQSPQYAPQPPQYAPQPPQYAPQPPAQDTFNPIEHTAEYKDGAFERPSTPQPGPDVDFSDFMDEPAAPQDLREAYKSFDEPEEAQKVQKASYAPALGTQQPYARPNYTVPPMQPVPPVQQVQPQTAAPKQKSSKGLIAVIIVLSVLLAASLIGILVYSINDSARNNSSSGKSEIEEDDPFKDIIPDFTFPRDDDKPRKDDEPKATTPAPTSPVHKESDYSDQTNKNYSGLVLEKKPADAAAGTYNAETAFTKASPSVVGVLGYTDSDEKSLGSEGSGIIMSEDGYVLTNAHVIGNSKTAYSIRVVTEDGVKYTAGVVGFDSRTDIALLKIKDAKGLTAATFGDSEELSLGEDILIIGNPGGLNYQNSMTKGIVSAIDREASSKSIVKYIQTDAAINPGNSGGPAVNMYGQVIGIASAKIVDEKYENMGFCIPSATVKKIVDDLMKQGYIEGRVKIGITGYAVTSSDMQMYDIPRGIVIQDIDENGPCGGTGLKSEDIITEADGTEITSFADIYKVLENHKEGDKIKLKYYRYSDESEGEVEVTLQADK